MRGWRVLGLRSTVLLLQEALIHGGYAAVFVLHALLLAVLGVAAWRERAARPPGDTAALDGASSQGTSALAGGRGLRHVAAIALVLLIACAARWSLEPAPQVYFDEFYYLATARHLAAAGELTPSLATPGVPAGHAFAHVLPPYSQGWPCMLAFLRWLPWVAGSHPWQQGVVLQRTLGVLTALLGWRLLSARSAAAGWYLAGTLALLPTLLRQGCGASAEGAALLWVLAAWGVVRSQRGRGGRCGLAWAVAVVAWVVHFRPESGLHVLVLLTWLFVPRMQAGAWREVVVATVAGAVLVLPDVVLVLGGAWGPFAGDHFRALPRPGFASMPANAWANLVNNLLFIVDGSLLPAYVTPLATLGVWHLLRRGRRLEALGGLLWVGLFVVALSPFPFGDLKAAHSFDTWRFAWNVELPLLLLGAAGIEALEGMPSRWARRGLGMALAFAVLSTPWSHAAFLNQTHPMADLARLARQVAAAAGTSTVVLRDRELALALQEMHGVRVVLDTTPEGDASRMCLPWVAQQARQGGVAFYDGAPDLPRAWQALPLEPLCVLRALDPTGQRTHGTLYAWRSALP